MTQERKPSEEKSLLKKKVRDFLDYWNQSSAPFLSDVYGLYYMDTKTHRVVFMNDSEYSLELDTRISKFEEDVKRLGIRVTAEQRLRAPVSA